MIRKKYCTPDRMQDLIDAYKNPALRAREKGRAKAWMHRAWNVPRQTLDTNIKNARRKRREATSRP
jgi:hypothetical protein